MDINVYDGISVSPQVILGLNPLKVDVSKSISCVEDFTGFAGQFIDVSEIISILEFIQYDENRTLSVYDDVSVVTNISAHPATLNINVFTNAHVVEQIFPYNYEIKPYGLRLTDKTGLKLVLTPDVGTVVAAGRISMPAGLNGDNTYGIDIDLPGTDPIPGSKISVLVLPTRPIIHAVSSQYISGGTFYYNTMYADSAAAYYSRNDSTGVMTSWAAGARTAGAKNTWNPILAVSPVAFWDKMGQVNFTAVRLFAGAAYMLREPHVDTNFSLSGSASGNPNRWAGPGVAGVNDNNEATWAGARVYVGWSEPEYTERTYDMNIQVAFSPRTVTMAQICHGMSADLSGGSASGAWIVSLYYSGAWHSIMTGNWFYYTNIPSVTHTLSGLWTNVTAIKVYAQCFGKKSSEYTEALTDYVCRELRVFGPDYNDISRNKMVYSIGSAVIPFVDYVILVKEWDF